MELTNTWQLASSTGLMIQKHGLAVVEVAYSAISPSGDDSWFTLRHSAIELFPPHSGNIDLWVRAAGDSAYASITTYGVAVEPVVGAFNSGFSSGFDI